MNKAPIALFVYNRLWHLQQTVDSLKDNLYASDSDLFIYSDGPKSESDKEKVDQVRNYIRSISGFKSITITERNKNLGLAQSIITGVTEIVNKYGKVIVLEDDLVTSPFFLKFMNEGLEFYKDKERVISIHGYIYPVREKLPETFFIRGADCLGWATWKRGWNIFDSNGEKLLVEVRRRKLVREFNFANTYLYTKLLSEQIEGKIDSWAIRWYASAFLNSKLTLYPGTSLVNHIGFDALSTHCAGETRLCTNLSTTPININNIIIEEDKYAKRVIQRFFFNEGFKLSFGMRINRKVKRLLRKIFSSN